MLISQNVFKNTRISSLFYRSDRSDFKESHVIAHCNHSIVKDKALLIRNKTKPQKTMLALIYDIAIKFKQNF